MADRKYPLEIPYDCLKGFWSRVKGRQVQVTGNKQLFRPRLDKKVQVGKLRKRRNQKEISTPKTEVGKN